MKNLAFALSFAVASLGAARAQDAVPAPAPAPTWVVVDPLSKPLRFVIGAGLTHGGDKLATQYYEDDYSIDLNGGDSIALLAGLDYRINGQFSVQGTIGYHFDDASARNGSMRFERIPLELLGYYHVNDRVRVGGGIRHVTNTEFRSGGASDIGDYRFDDSTGAVAELEYMYSHRIGFKLRWADDAFREKRSRIPVKGDHIGLLVNFYF